MCWLEPFAKGGKIRGLGEEHNLLRLSSPVTVPGYGLILMSLLLACELRLEYASSLSEEVLAPLLWSPLIGPRILLPGLGSGLISSCSQAFQEVQHSCHLVLN